MTTTRVDRAALVRRAMVELVADRGIHGTSMSQVAERAGVATGTAYVHYESKEDLLVAAFVEVKRRLGHAAMINVDATRDVREVFETAWRNVYSHLRDDPAVARFLLQVETSPLRGPAHEALMGDDPLTATAQAMAEHLVALPLEVVYDVGIAPAVRLAASELELGRGQLSTLVDSCWRAVRR